MQSSIRLKFSLLGQIESLLIVNSEIATGINIVPDFVPRYLDEKVARNELSRSTELTSDCLSC